MEIQIVTADQMSLENFNANIMDRNRVAVRNIDNAQADGAGVALSSTPDRDNAFQRFLESATGRGAMKQNAPVSCHASLEMAPSYPTTGTQAARLLAALLAGKEINPLVGWFSLGIYRLSDTVLRLRHLCWPIVTGRLDVKNRFGEECHVANYYLQPEAVECAGDRGREFRSAALARKDAV